MRVALVGLLLLGAPAVLNGQSIAVVDVTVIPMDRETTLTHQTVVVRGERILSVGPTGNTPVPDDAVIIDGAGRYLVPGLTDAHVHLAGTVFGPGRPQFGDAPLYLAYGVTTVFDLGGTTEHLDWRGRILTGELLAPTIYTSPPFFNEPRVNSPEEVEREIAITVAAGYDLLKFREIVGRDPAPTTNRPVADGVSEDERCGAPRGPAACGPCAGQPGARRDAGGASAIARARRRAHATLLQSGHASPLVAHRGRHRTPDRPRGRVDFCADGSH